MATHICTDENFKALKLKKAELELIETERRITLIEAQTQESQSRNQYLKILIAKNSQEPGLRNDEWPIYANLWDDTFELILSIIISLLSFSFALRFL